jgi:hypothetical protein
MDPITQIQQLVGQRALYPLIATVLTFAIQVARKSRYTARVWNIVPDGYRWLWPVVTGAITGFTHGFGAGRPLSGALIEMVLGIFGVSFTAMGLAATLRESPVQWDGGAGGKPTEDEPTA